VSDYTIMRHADAPDYTGEAPGAFLGYARPMGAGQLAFNVRVLEPHTPHVPPRGDPTAGHSHDTMEEIYFVVSGEITIKLDDDVTTLGPLDAVLIPPTTTRSYRNDGDVEAVVAMYSVKVADPMAESHKHEEFWPAG
jgi:mannose-6-phosphate isomerase-like protein (cupin superfamily)